MRLLFERAIKSRKSRNAKWIRKSEKREKKKREKRQYSLADKGSGKVMSRLSTGTMRGCRARAACSHARSNLMHTYTNTHPHYSRLPSSPSKRPQARSCGFVTRRRERSWASCRTVVVVAAAPVGIFYSTGTGSTKRIANSIKVRKEGLWVCR